jgi:hypothetical protein
MSDQGGAWLVTGIQPAGKSTVVTSWPGSSTQPCTSAAASWATSGWVHPGDAAQTDRARRLLDLRYRLSALTAAEYCDAGFTAVVQDTAPT